MGGIASSRINCAGKIVRKGARSFSIEDETGLANPQHGLPVGGKKPSKRKASTKQTT